MFQARNSSLPCNLQKLCDREFIISFLKKQCICITKNSQNTHKKCMQKYFFDRYMDDETLYWGISIL